MELSPVIIELLQDFYNHYRGVDVDELLSFNERSNQLMYTFETMRLMFYKQQSDFWTILRAGFFLHA